MTTRTLKLIVWAIVALAIFIIAFFLFTNPSLITKNVSAGAFSVLKYADSEKYSVGSASCNNVESLSIDWVDGSVTIVPSNGRAVTFSEKSEKNLSETDTLHWYNDNGTLRIKYSASGLRTNTNLHKDLVVTVPSNVNLSQLELEIVSANASIDSISTETLEIETVSGEVYLNNTSFKKLDLESVSGDCTVILSNTLAPKTIDMEAVSGNLELYVPKDMGFSARLESISGDLKCDLPVKFNGKKVERSGASSFAIEVETISGDLSLLEK